MPIQVETPYFPHISTKFIQITFFLCVCLCYEFLAKCIPVTVRKQSILMMPQTVLKQQTALSPFFTSKHSLLILIIFRGLALQVVHAVHITVRSPERQLTMLVFLPFYE